MVKLAIAAALFLVAITGAFGMITSVWMVIESIKKRDKLPIYFLILTMFVSSSFMTFFPAIGFVSCISGGKCPF